MPKNRSPRTTDDPLGLKLLQVLREKGHEDDLNYLAAEFGVKVQSVYDWINHGRISKDRYSTLVSWSGRSLHWWFDVPQASDESAADTRNVVPLVREERSKYSPSWPFTTIDAKKVQHLTQTELAWLEGVLVGIAAARGMDVAKSAAH